MKFGLKDFSHVIEVQFSEEMRQKLKPFFPTTPNRPYHNIAKRLFTVWSHSGNKGKNGQLHKPFVPVTWVKDIMKFTGVSYQELERSVVAARSGYGGSIVFFPQRLPLEATEDHAWLLGMFFSSGGIDNRERGQSWHPLGRYIRFCVSDPVVEKLTEIGNRIGDVPHVYDPNIRVRTGKAKRTGIGNRRRKSVKFHSVTVEILAKFGLPKYSVSVKKRYGWEKLGRGRLYSLRNIGLKLPRWIVENEKCMHAFVEGYINGQKGASWAYSKPRKHYRIVECHVQVRVAGMNKKQTLSFLTKIARYLKKIGVSGKIRPMTYPNSAITYWLAYEIHRDESLCNLFSRFNILKPDLRARLFLMKHKNLLLLRMLQKFDSLTTVIFGLLLEKPRTVEEICLLLRLKKSQVHATLEKLRIKHLIEDCGEKIRVNGQIFKEKQLESYSDQIGKLKTKLEIVQDQFFLRCDCCGKIVSKPLKDCDCGGTFNPIERLEVLSLLGRRQIALSRDLKRIQRSRLPSETFKVA